MNVLTQLAELTTLPLIAVLVLALFVLVFGVGRLVRLVTYDEYPPTVAIRAWWMGLVDGSGWEKLVSCFWCLTPWVVLVASGWFIAGLYVAWIGIAWFAFWGWLAVSYAISMLVDRDES